MSRPDGARVGRRPQEAGFTLVEIMIAAVVLSVGLVGAALAITYTLQLARDARDTEIAAADLSSAVELVRGVPFIALPSAYPDMQAIAAFAKRHLPDEAVYVHYPTPGTDPLEVRVTITFTDLKGASRSSMAALARTR